MGRREMESVGLGLEVPLEANPAEHPRRGIHTAMKCGRREATPQDPLGPQEHEAEASPV